jgi:DMSO/TMAO reductase YedYZ heme-binding membrane subunit
LHLTQTIINYTGPMLIVDPKGEQLKRTAAYRRQLGPVYCLPGNQMHLSAYYQHLRDRDAAQELHYHLIRPWMGTDPILGVFA